MKLGAITVLYTMKDTKVNFTGSSEFALWTLFQLLIWAKVPERYLEPSQKNNDAGRVLYFDYFAFALNWFIWSNISNLVLKLLWNSPWMALVHLFVCKYLCYSPDVKLVRLSTLITK